MASAPAILSMFSYISVIYSFSLGSIILVPLLRIKRKSDFSISRIMLFLGMFIYYIGGENLCISFHNELDVGF